MEGNKSLEMVKSCLRQKALVGSMAIGLADIGYLLTTRVDSVQG